MKRHSFAHQMIRKYSSDLKHRKDQESTQVSQSQQILADAFTKQVDTGDALAALILKAASAPEAAEALKEQFAALRDTVDVFNRTFPDISEKNGSSRSFNWQSLHKTVLQMRDQHNAKSVAGSRGKAKAKFHDICATIDEHISILKILPQGDHYVAPICGSVELIVKASVNYEHIGEEFSNALREIDDIVVLVKQELTLSQDVILLGWTIELCCKIINFLGFPLRWYSQKRWKTAIAAFNESLSEQYQGQVAQIRRLADLIRHGVGIRTAVQVDKLHDNFSEVADFVLEARKHHQDFFAWTEHLPTRYDDAVKMLFQNLYERSDEHFNAMQQYLKAATDNMTGAAARQLIHWQAREYDILNASSPTFNQPAFRALAESPAPAALQPLDTKILGTRMEAYTIARAWYQFFEPGRIILDFPNTKVFVEGKAAQCLQSWTAQTSSSILGILGPASSNQEDAARLLTSNYVRASRRAGIPCISYFCNTMHEEPPPNRTRETLGLTQLLYALLHQLVVYLPDQLPQSPDLSQHMSSNLDGTLRTWSTALALLRSLITAAEPPFLLIAVHGVESLEDQFTMPCLESLFDLFRDIVSQKSGKGPKVKVLLTTSGLSQLLNDKLREDEVCDISRGNSSRRPGRPWKGRRRMGDPELEDD